ncbi:MAG: hypothetical protein HY094_01430 [Candidatus Melainabacteria bacterium]|nr:hypothetical protein [Candidatus Melainabacteria bacterium]
MKDPYLKPVIFGGLFITMLSVVFAPGIFLWAIVGGYITVRLAKKLTKETIPLLEGLLLGLFSGVIGGTCLDVLTVISFKSPENQQLLIRTLEKNWPREIHPPANFHDILPSIFVTTCIFVVLISILFASIGGYIGTVISKQTKKIDS